MSEQNDRLVSVEIDDDSLSASGPEAEHERRVAIFDLVESNNFRICDYDGTGPYKLQIAEKEKKLVFEISLESGVIVHTYLFSLSPYRSLIRDYFMICESYYAAIRTQSLHQIEAIDMARRGIHNEASEVLMERLKGKIEIDFDTARRLFTLICALHTGTMRAP